MNEIQKFQQEEVRQDLPAQHQKKPKFLVKKPLRKGQTLFEFNFKENTIKKCPFDHEKVVHFDQAVEITSLIPKKVIIQPNCLYIPALNFKNAIRHIQNKISKEYNPKIID
jgi:hypothetical protein